MLSSKLIMRCKCCKIDLTESLLFQNNQIWTDLQELFKQKRIVDPEFIQLVKDQTKEMCFNCGSVNACKSAMLYMIAGFLEKTVFDDVALFCNLALNFREQSTLVKAIDIVEQTIIEQKIDTVKAHAILFALTQINGKSRHLKEKEKEMMRILKGKGMSNQDISTIFGRSKETVHRALKEVQT